MPLYQFRYFFDPGSGICLWSANEAAKEKFDYPVDLNDLNLPDILLGQAGQLMAWFDTSIDWQYPPNPSPWSSAELSRFNAAAQDLLHSLRQTLGPDFEIRDESKTERVNDFETESGLS